MRRPNAWLPKAPGMKGKRKGSPWSPTPPVPGKARLGQGNPKGRLDAFVAAQQRAGDTGRGSKKGSPSLQGLGYRPNLQRALKDNAGVTKRELTAFGGKGKFSRYVGDGEFVNTNFGGPRAGERFTVDKYGSHVYKDGTVIRANKGKGRAATALGSSTQKAGSGGLGVVKGGGKVTGRALREERKFAQLQPKTFARKQAKAEARKDRKRKRPSYLGAGSLR